MPRSTTKSRPATRSRAHSFVRDWLKQNWRTLALIGGLAIGISIFWGRLDVDEVHAWAKRMPAGWAFLLMLVLPLIGCPATLVNLAAGVRFGIAGGLPLVALAITIHQFIAFALVRWMPGMFTKLVRPLRERLPRGSHKAVTMFSALLPGIPYWMQVYSMPMLGIPLRTVLLCAVPFHTMRSLLALVGGGISDHLTPWSIAGLVAYATVLMTACAVAGRRLRKEMANRRRPTRATRLEPAVATAGK